MSTVSHPVCGALLAIALLPVACGHADATPAPALSVRAAPWAIIAHGPRLPKPITLSDWHENLRLLLATPGPGTPTAAHALHGRPYLELALFWGPDWKHLSGSPEAVARLRPEQANQRGWLFLAEGDQPAAIVLDPPTLPVLATTLSVRVVGADGLAVFRQHGVPVRITP